eukprot:comp22491_c0_seq1/m.55896 comp22491_c0_seq1/g.55896  ORF comp22491_c0_seq1/g.55896 comp22491_c0_seq1/m.55896 type:complete len:357 (+) comp22491_c0_seq1:2631-3701(+)
MDMGAGRTIGEIVVDGIGNKLAGKIKGEERGSAGSADRESSLARLQTGAVAVFETRERCRDLGGWCCTACCAACCADQNVRVPRGVVRGAVGLFEGHFVAVLDADNEMLIGRVVEILGLGHLADGGRSGDRGVAVSRGDGELDIWIRDSNDDPVANGTASELDAELGRGRMVKLDRVALARAHIELVAVADRLVRVLARGLESACAAKVVECGAERVCIRGLRNSGAKVRVCGVLVLDRDEQERIVSGLAEHAVPLGLGGAESAVVVERLLGSDPASRDARECAVLVLCKEGARAVLGLALGVPRVRVLLNVEQVGAVEILVVSVAVHCKEHILAVGQDAENPRVAQGIALVSAEL